jgi:hypothetical protein
MKTITHYDCEICNSRFDKVIDAENCEAVGRPSKVLRVGVAWEHSHHDDQKDGTSGVILVVNKAFVSGHSIGYRTWGFRDNGAGDNGPADTKGDSGFCGVDVYPPYEHRYRKPKTSTSRFRRARAELKKIGIKIIAWDGTIKCFEAAP